MSDVIKVLPDSVANQIAAGEVVQRPASVVKELVENSIDAGATSIELVVKDAGRTLIQVTDNGMGMSEMDARLCFERHATSKISKAEDLFHLHTKGFRGEAMASISAIAHVEMKTRLHDAEIGCAVHIEGSRISRQEPAACPVGTTIMVKNLFYNVPARRNFLKSDAVEFKHVLEEFMRIALSHNDIRFKLVHNGKVMYDLPGANRLKRIMNLMGKDFNSKLVPVDCETDIVRITGYTGKAEHARKTRGEQYLFINGRFFKDHYLHHAITSAYSDLLPEKHYPSYFLFFEIDPERIDVNIHPTKTEIKFQDDRAIYQILKSTLRKSLGEYNVAPTLDFSKNKVLENMMGSKPKSITPPSIEVNPDFNPFKSSPSSSGGGNSGSSAGSSSSSRRPGNAASSQDWENLNLIYSEEAQPKIEEVLPEVGTEESNQAKIEVEERSSPLLAQLPTGYIVTTLKKGLTLIDPARAKSRITYDRTLSAMEEKMPSQAIAFPLELNLRPEDILYLETIKPVLENCGFILESKNDKLLIQGQPSGLDIGAADELIGNMLGAMKDAEVDEVQLVAEHLAKSVSSRVRSRRKSMSQEEMELLLSELFSCVNPMTTSTGETVMLTLTHDEIQKRF